MFRRPAPGRPARQCGHPKAAKCDCLAKRTLCCALTSEQWDQVVEGQIIKVSMFDSRDELDAAQMQQQAHPQPTPHTLLDSANTYTNSSFSSASTPAPDPRIQMYVATGSQGSIQHETDIFPWPGETGQMPVHELPSQYQQIPHRPPIAQAVPPYQQFNDTLQGQVSGITQPSPHHSGSVPQTPWPQPRPEYMPFHSPHYPARHDAQFEATELEHMHLSPQPQIAPQQHFAIPTPHSQYNVNVAMPQYFDPVDLPAVSNFPMDRNPPTQHFEPAQPPNPTSAVTQSCCSGKRSQPTAMNDFSNWHFPASAPTQQFPCPRCASTMCTCTDCPEVMQSVEQNGAWARACGRAGHLDAVEFSVPNVLSEQPESIASAPPVTRSCCGGGSRSSSGAPTAETSPFPVDPPGWAAHIDGHNMHEPHTPNTIFSNGMTVDPAILYQLNDWEVMR